MKQEVLRNFSHTFLPIIGMFIFLTLFIGMLYWVLSKRRDPLYSKASQLPLE